MKGIPWAAACWLAGLSAAMSGGSGEIILCAAAVLLGACGWLMIRRAFPVAALCLAAFALAAVYGLWHQKDGGSLLPESGPAVLAGVLASQPEIDGDRVRFTLRTADGERVAVTVRLADRRELEEVETWRRGDEARLSGELSLPRGPRNFGQFDYAAYLAKRGIYRVLTVGGVENASIRRPERFGAEKALGWVESVRHNIGERIAELYPGKQSGFMQAMLIGLDAEIDGGLYNAFARLGLTHVIAISGLHVGVVIGGWLFVLRLARIPREAALKSAYAVVPLYVLLAGAAPSVVRSGIMAMLGVFALRRGWRKDAMRFVALAAVAMTALNPPYLHDVGFQLSFLVTAGLVAGTPAAMSLLPARWPKWLSGSAAVTVTAQIVSFPLSVYYFNQYSLLSGFANFLLVPVFSLIVLPAGYLSLLASAASMPVARWLAAVPRWLNDLSFRLIEFGSRIDGAGTIWPSPPVPAILLYYLILAAICAGIARWRSEERDLFPAQARNGRRTAILGVCLIVVWFAAVYRIGDWQYRGTVSFLDVGQGDAILIRTPLGKTILVDGGGTIRFERPGEEWRTGRDPYEIGKDLLVPLLMKRGVRKIDVMIATHGDADHAGGLAAVAEAIPTRRIVFNGTLADSDAFRRLVGVALGRNIPLNPAGFGQTLVMDRHTRLDFLYPVLQDGLYPEEDQNASSVVFLLTMHGKRLLFTGDMDAAAERETVRLLRMAQRQAGTFPAETTAGAQVPDRWPKSDVPRESKAAGVTRKSVAPSVLTPAESTEKAVDAAVAPGVFEQPLDVMKIAHHGSNSSTSELWLNRWKPRLAVISVGERNVYGHPGRLVLARLQRHGIPVLRTDLHGEIQLKIRPGNITWRTYLNPGNSGHGNSGG